MDRKAHGSVIRSIIAVTVIAAAAGAAGYFMGSQDPPPPALVPEIEVKPVDPPAPVVTDVTLARADIIRLANEAADAASGGPALKDQLDGRRFELRVAFGCQSGAPPVPARGASYSLDGSTLRLRVVPQDWTELPWVKEEAARLGLLGANGFWIPRPWTRNDSCTPGQPEAAGRASGLGIAQFFDSDASRVGLQGKKELAATVRVDPGDMEVNRGLSMVLTGRLVRWPGGSQTVLCNAAGPLDRPTCLVGTKLDSISIESASGKRLADWQI